MSLFSHVICMLTYCQESSIAIIGDPSHYKDGLSGYGISIIKIRRLTGRLIFGVGIPILLRQHLYIKTAPMIQLQAT